MKLVASLGVGADESVNVPTDQQITILLSEAADPQTVTGDAVYLMDPDDNRLTDAQVALEDHANGMAWYRRVEATLNV